MELNNTQELRNLIWNTVIEMFGIDASQVSNSAVIFQPKSYTVSGVPSAATFPRGVIYVSNESGGPTLAFSDGTNWRRVQDRNVIT